ncbi:hypothetical protein CFO_g1372 [Ceratocystis platani]|uniref:Endonuclease/Exonuclease/phosphatase family protein n=1 Tax=Ceratocystis fimbriata f. sp. platani TaxID=88771 RepID=A0A0F8BUQ7_CERFI|nr:hypothetical protein CFO_g1372 [Ceratocystis platani]
MKYNGIVAAIAALSTPAIVHAASGTFQVLTMNVAGNPDFNYEAKMQDAQEIGRLFNSFGHDVIKMQSDFESHVGIYETNSHPYRTTALGGLGKGDGLDTLSKIPFSDFRRIKWDKCSNAEGGDCDAPKGFTFMRMRIDEGIYIDVYNLQADGGTQVYNSTARSENLIQLSEYIKTWSDGNAVMVFGGTNALFSRLDDNISIFDDQNGMSDAWSTVVRKGDSSADAPCGNISETLMCELGDKVFSRGSPLLILESNEFNYIGKAFSRRDGSLMSDRDPVQEWFNDAPTLAAKDNRPKAAIIAFSGGNRLDKVSVTLDDTTSFEHGGGGGDMKDLTLEADEYWTIIDLCQGEGEGKNRIFYAKATTTKDRVLEISTRGASSVSELELEQPPSENLAENFLHRTSHGVIDIVELQAWELDSKLDQRDWDFEIVASSTALGSTQHMGWGILISIDNSRDGRTRVPGMACVSGIVLPAGG